MSWYINLKKMLDFDYNFSKFYELNQDHMKTSANWVNCKMQQKNQIYSLQSNYTYKKNLPEKTK